MAPARRTAALLGFLLLAACGSVVLVVAYGREVEIRRGRALSINSLRNLADLAVARTTRRGWPPYGGKALVLWLVASKELDRRNRQNLEALWSPFDAAYRGPDSLRSEAYERATPEALAAGLDVRHLTSYVGPRSADDSRHAEAPSVTPRALFADLHVPDGAIVAFTDRSVRYLSRRELGLGPDDPIVAGESSRSPILRQLSE